jgi:hypothetical protein
MSKLRTYTSTPVYGFHDIVLPKLGTGTRLSYQDNKTGRQYGSYSTHGTEEKIMYWCRWEKDINIRLKEIGFHSNG